jgi:hypothetical protein
VSHILTSIIRGATGVLLQCAITPGASKGASRFLQSSLFVPQSCVVRNYQPSSRNHQPSTSNHQPLTINKQLSTINHLLSTISNHQPSTINKQPSTINHQPSTINKQPSTNNHQPSTRNPALLPMTRNTVHIHDTLVQLPPPDEHPCGASQLCVDSLHEYAS